MKYTINNPKLVLYLHEPEEDNFTGVVKNEYGSMAYYENGERHRTNGPAIIWNGGRKEWYINGKTHREDGPAVEFPDGGKQWWYNDTCYGYNDSFTVDSWVKKWELEIFK